MKALSHFAAELRRFERIQSFWSTFPLAGKAGVVTIAAAVMLAVTLTLVLWLWHDRTRIFDEGTRVASNLAQVLEEQTGRTFQAADLTLVGVIDALRLSAPLRQHDPQFEEALRRHTAALPYVRALFVTDGDGFLTQDSNHPRTPRLTVADRDYFIAHATNSGPELYISPPLLSKLTGTWFVSMSRRIENADGSFGGVAVASIEPTYFQEFYKTLELGRGDNIALFREDGILIARNPPTMDLIGQAFPQFRLFGELKKSRHGTFRTESLIDDVPRIFSYRRLESFPLVVTVGLSETVLLAHWHWDVAAALAYAAVVATLIGILMTIVTRQQRRREQERLRLARAQHLEALGQLTGGIAHDFRNLVAVVQAGTGRIAKRCSDPKVQQTAGMIYEAAERGSGLVAQLLAFARQQAFTVRPEDVNAMLRDIEVVLRCAAVPKAQIDLDLKPDIWPCLADRAQFDAAILNLVVNARDAVSPGGKIRIATANWHAGSAPFHETLQPGDYVRVTVTDNGQGMGPEVLQHALDPFFTTKSETGTGLGLSQVYGFVRQAGGDVTIESRVGVGTSVHLFFRRADNAAAHVSHRHPEEMRGSSNMPALC
jgi:signal transduction histidine kinase